MAMTHDAAKMVDAMTERPNGATLSARVADCLRSRVIATRALSEVKREIDAINPSLGREFWRLAGVYLTGAGSDEEGKLRIIDALKAVEPKPPARPMDPSAPSPAPGPAATPSAEADDALSRHLQETFGLRGATA